MLGRDERNACQQTLSTNIPSHPKGTQQKPTSEKLSQIKLKHPSEKIDLCSD